MKLSLTATIFTSAITCVLSALSPNSASAEYLNPIVASEIHKITITGPTSVQAGSYVVFKLKSDKSINGNCFLSSQSKGFANLDFYFAGKNKSVKFLPIQPGAGALGIECHNKNESTYGVYQLYIKR